MVNWPSSNQVKSQAVTAGYEGLGSIPWLLAVCEARAPSPTQADARGRADKASSGSLTQGPQMLRW